MDAPMRDRKILERLGENLLEARRQAGCSQAELARRSCLHPTYVSYIERGMRLPRIDTVMRLAGALDVGVEVLVRGIEWSPPPLPPSLPWCGFAVRPAA